MASPTGQESGSALGVAMLATAGCVAFTLLLFPLGPEWAGTLVIAGILAISFFQNNARQSLLPHQINPLLLSPTEYEEYCANLLKQAGWRIALTKGSGDQGADVVAELRGIKAVVQCKRYGKRVGNAAVQQAVASKAYYGAQVAVVVCPVGYTAHARALAKKNRAILLLHHQLSDLEKLARIP